MSLWIPITIAAAFFQTLRFMLQKTLSAQRLSAAGATFARFAYSAPLVVLGLIAYTGLTVPDWPGLTVPFWIYGAVGGLAQILATICVVLLFKERNFAVGITFKKTEVIQTVLVGALILGEGVGTWGFCAILVGLLGVLMLSELPGGTGPWTRRFLTRAAGLGLTSGFFFAISGVCVRAASLEIASGDPVLRAWITLAAITSMQMLSMGFWLAWKQRGQITAVWRARAGAVWIGLTSMAGSLCWFTAYTLQNAALVSAVGQVELIFSLLASWLFFRERIGARELLGIVVLGVSILLLILVV